MIIPFILIFKSLQIRSVSISLSPVIIFTSTDKSSNSEIAELALTFGGSRKAAKPINVILSSSWFLYFTLSSIASFLIAIAITLNPSALNLSYSSFAVLLLSLLNSNTPLSVSKEDETAKILSGAPFVIKYLEPSCSTTIESLLLSKSKGISSIFL